MKKIEKLQLKSAERNWESADIRDKINELVEASNTINEVLSDKICGCGTPFKNHGTGRSGYCTSKPSEEEIDWDKADKAQVRPTEAEIRADERRVLRERLEETELHYKDWSNKEAFFSKEDIDDLLK